MIGRNHSMTIYSLYIKTHNKTGLKYLGYTKQNPNKYKGSGTYWRRHLSVHGNDVSTEILLESESHNEIKTQGLFYSNKWNVVNSEEWANLKPETGEGGSSPRTTSTRAKIREFQKNKTWTEKAIRNRLENCLKSAAKRKGTKWSDKLREARLIGYISKNFEIALKIIDLDNQGLNKLQIAKQLGVSWEKVKYSLLHREDFMAYKPCDK